MLMDYINCLALNFFTFISLRMCRESMYQILSQTTPENTSKNYADYSINPRTRYTRVNLSSISTSQVRTVIFYLLNTDFNLEFNPPKGLDYSLAGAVSFK